MLSIFSFVFVSRHTSLPMLFVFFSPCNKHTHVQPSVCIFAASSHELVKKKEKMCRCCMLKRRQSKGASGETRQTTWQIMLHNRACSALRWLHISCIVFDSTHCRIHRCFRHNNCLPLLTHKTWNYKPNSKQDACIINFVAYSLAYYEKQKLHQEGFNAIYLFIYSIQAFTYKHNKLTVIFCCFLKLLKKYFKYIFKLLWPCHFELCLLLFSIHCTQIEYIL